jgi:lysyl-tRNA synthetase class 2
MSGDREDWRPSARLERLQRRAALLGLARDYFARRGAMEVDTPVVIGHAVTDINIESSEVHIAGSSGPPRYLHTSPEYAMKRLLAAGSGDIYQICHVVRGAEQGRLHNQEFTLIEWYRVGWPMRRLMQEVATLLRTLLGDALAGDASFVSYVDALRTGLGVDALTASDTELADCAAAQGFDAGLIMRCGRDQLLDLLMGARVGPTLGRDGLSFVHRYPASQAALARLDPDDPRVALRFEVYCRGIELANGFEELGDAAEQRARFEADRCQRQRRNLPMHVADERLLTALAHGLPPCSGVAVGFDRVLMLACGASRLEEVLPFAADRA